MALTYTWSAGWPEWRFHLLRWYLLQIQGAEESPQTPCISSAHCNETPCQRLPHPQFKHSPSQTFLSHALPFDFTCITTRQTASVLFLSLGSTSSHFFFFLREAALSRQSSAVCVNKMNEKTRGALAQTDLCARRIRDTIASPIPL